jgi:membrane-bound ClpP family serine protease
MVSATVLIIAGVVLILLAWFCYPKSAGWIVFFPGSVLCLGFILLVTGVLSFTNYSFRQTEKGVEASATYDPIKDLEVVKSTHVQGGMVLVYLKREDGSIFKALSKKNLEKGTRATIVNLEYEDHRTIPIVRLWVVESDDK